LNYILVELAVFAQPFRSDQMKLLPDHELLKLLETKKDQSPLFTGIDPKKPLGKDSQVQPSSIDLTIGHIFFPERDPTEDGGLNNPLENASLLPGQTAIVVAAEKAIFPANISGFAFPPTSISTAGILMTNPGHIDPGFVGYLSFTVINMSKKRYDLKKGKPLVTCLIVQLESNATLPYREQGHPEIGPTPKPSTLDRLTLDFLNLEHRARKTAVGVTRKELARFSVIGLIAAVIGLAIPAWLALFEPLMDVSNQVTELREQLSSISPPQGPDIKVSMASLASELSSLSAKAQDDRSDNRAALAELASKLEKLSELMNGEFSRTQSSVAELRGQIEQMQAREQP
jgi:deoxycytidine triphosphate deaminase